MIPLFKSLPNMWFIAQLPTESTAVPSWTWVVVVAAIVAAVVIVLTLKKNRDLTQEQSTQGKTLSDLKEEHRLLREKSRKQTKELDQSKDERKKTKQDLATQRKKTHAAQEEAKTLRRDLKDQQHATDKARTTRSAFVNKPEAPEPKKEEKPAPAKPALKGITLAELQDKVHSLQAAKDKFEAALGSERDAAGSVKAEVKQLARRVEGYRRVDILSKSKLEITEDKLKQLGRQYYDAVSELALLKGEVQPLPAPGAHAEPKPKPVLDEGDPDSNDEKEEQEGETPEAMPPPDASEVEPTTSAT